MSNALFGQKITKIHCFPTRRHLLGWTERLGLPASHSFIHLLPQTRMRSLHGDRLCAEDTGYQEHVHPRLAQSARSDFPRVGCRHAGSSLPRPPGHQGPSGGISPRHGPLTRAASRTRPNGPLASSPNGPRARVPMGHAHDIPFLKQHSQVGGTRGLHQSDK